MVKAPRHRVEKKLERRMIVTLDGTRPAGINNNVKSPFFARKRRGDEAGQSNTTQLTMDL
jgi:hypothetical protein